MTEENGMLTSGSGGTWIWVFFLFFLLAWGGNGFGGGFGNGGASAATNQINNDFMYTNLANTLNNGFTQNQQQNFDIQKDVMQSTSTLNQTLCAGFTGVNSGIANIAYQIAQNTCAITTNATANTQHILDKLCEMEKAAKDETIYALRTDLQAAQLQLGNVAQTQNIVNQLRPVPVPAYITCSPYTSVSACNCSV